MSKICTDNRNIQVKYDRPSNLLEFITLMPALIRDFVNNYNLIASKIKTATQSDAVLALALKNILFLDDSFGFSVTTYSLELINNGNGIKAMMEAIGSESLDDLKRIENQYKALVANNSLTIPINDPYITKISNLLAGFELEIKDFVTLWSKLQPNPYKCIAGLGVSFFLNF